MADLSDADIKIAENLNKANDALEQNFIYQFIGATLFFIYYYQNSYETLPLMGIALKSDLLRLVFPIGMVYVMIKMAILFMAYIEWAEMYFERVRQFEEKSKSYSLFFLLRPRSIFMAIPMAREPYNKSSRSRRFCFIGSALIFLFPGGIMSLILISINRYEYDWMTWLLFALTTILFGGLYMQFHTNKMTRHYRYLLVSSYVACVIIFFTAILLPKQVDTQIRIPNPNATQPIIY
jgi:hypothetical protein